MTSLIQIIAVIFALLLYSVAPLWALGAQDSLGILNCHAGVKSFALSLRKFIEHNEEKYAQLDSEKQIGLLYGKSRIGAELTLFAIPVVSQEFSGKLILVSCWDNLYSFSNHVKADDLLAADKDMIFWKSCATKIYEKQLPAAAQQVLNCYESAKQRKPR